VTGTEVLDISREAVYTLLLVAGPIMAVALVVGIAIALFQSLTQIQEMTLTFAPKILAIFASLLVLLPFMGSQLQRFENLIADRIANIP
jgi:flagellar biosynthetic protein FliQ